MNKINWFMVDLDMVSTDDVVEDVCFIERTFSVKNLMIIPTSNSCYHICVLLNKPEEFDYVLNTITDTRVDEKYINLVRERGMFYERIDILKRLLEV